MSFRGLCLLLAVCVTTACRPPAPADPGPAEVVQTFLGAYRGNFREADTSAISAPLREAIGSAVGLEERSRAAVLASEFPTDKPHLLEGEIFSGLYEGFTGFELGVEEVTQDRATVDVRFTNSHYATGWTDRVQLVDADGWKIDDVRYLDKKTGALGLREVLRDFEQAASQDPLLHPSQP
jgi:hypothetical protein